MKKLSAIFALLCIAASMSAQDESIYFTDDLKPRFSVEIGYNHLFDGIKEWNLGGGLTASGDARKYNGFSAGFGVDFPISEYFVFKTGLQVMFDGGKGDTALTAPYSGSNFGVIAPVFIKWCLQGEAQNGLNLFAGPILHYGILSKSRTSLHEYDNYKSGDFFGSGLNRFNVFLGGGIGYDYDYTFGARVGFYGGLVNSFKDSEEGRSFRNRLEITLIYYFQ